MMRAASALVALSLAAGACIGSDPPPDATSRVADPPGDVQPAPSSDTPQPPGIDLVSAELARIDGTLRFTATTADAGGDRPRLWVVRLRDTKGVLLHMLYAGDEGVMLCNHARFCSNRVAVAAFDTTPTSVDVRLPMPGLPDRFEWEASASASFTADIDDTWNDSAPTAILSG